HVFSLLPTLTSKLTSDRPSPSTLPTMPAVTRPTTESSQLKAFHIPSARDIGWAKRLRLIEKKRGKKFAAGLPLRFQVGRRQMICAAEQLISIEPLISELKAFNSC
ncbi:hypothetical protein PFISCL1PPCAC_17919, partial [Pristionchus fissidentatus]